MMKKTTMLLLMAALMVLAGCEKDNGTNSHDPQPQPQPQSISLAGTSWECNISNEVYEQGVLIRFNVLYVLDLNDDVNGEMFSDVEVEVPAYPQANQTDNTSWPVTYCFDGTTLTLLFPDEEEEYEDIMTYNPADTTFTEMILDPEMQEFYGTDRFIYHLSRGTVNF